MKKENFGLSFKLKFSTGTTASFIHNGGLENKKIRTEKFPAALQPGEISPTLLALAIAASPTLKPKQWQEPNIKKQLNYHEHI